MLKIREKHSAFLCLTAALFTFLTPVLFLFHADRCGAYSLPDSVSFRQPPRPDFPAGRKDRERLPGYTHSHGRNAHDPNACATCRALIQYVSGATLEHAHEAAVPESSPLRGFAASALSPCENRFPPFFSRAPPPSSALHPFKPFHA